jgi:putative membrane protein
VFLDPEAESAVKQRVAGIERSTGVEVVAAIVARADSYPEIPWKAFALGSALSLFAATVAVLIAPGWEAAESIVETAVAALATGAAAALATVWIEPLARLFLSRARRQAEALQYAQAIFLETGLQRTPRRDGILLLVSLFEHEVVVLADRGVRDRLGAAALDAAVVAVTAALKRGHLKEALLGGLARLEEALAAGGFRAQPAEPDEVAETLIQQRGPS